MANKDLAPEQQSDTLPSYGLSKLLDITDKATFDSIMNGISQGNFNLRDMQRSSEGNDAELVARGSSFGSSGSASGSADSTQEGANENEPKNQVFNLDGLGAVKMEQTENSSTECIQNTNLDTVDPQQLQTGGLVAGDDQLFGEGVAMEVTVEESQMEGFLEPKITFTEVAKYSRFRYESERSSKTQRSTKGKNLDTADEYKSLGTIKVEGYIGQAYLVIFCVDSKDRIHPYSLHGDFCDKGIYVQVLDLKADLQIKLNRVTFTTPKSKQYKEIFERRRKDLKDLNIDVKAMGNTDMDKSDKNTVYLHAEVHLGDTITKKHTVSDAIHNKKEGNEFKIYTIEPASAPATGYHPGNPNKDRVLIVLTDGTAFPKHVAVKIKSLTGEPWEVLLSGKDIKTIRKSVVEFYPPPYHSPNTSTDVEMAVCLVDQDTKDESNCVKFVYRSVQDLEGLQERKRKKPRLNTSAVMSCSRQSSGGASGDVLTSLEPSWKKSWEDEIPSAETNINIPTYSEMLDNQKQAEAGNGKIYSLKENTRNDDLTPRGPGARSVQQREETGQGRSCIVPGASPSPVRRSDLPELKQSQMTVNLPKQSANWAKGLQNQPTTAVVTSTSGLSANSLAGLTIQEPTIAFPPKLSSKYEPSSFQLQTTEHQPQQRSLQQSEPSRRPDQPSDFQLHQAQSAPQQPQNLDNHRLLQQLQSGQQQVQQPDFQLHQAQAALQQPLNPESHQSLQQTQLQQVKQQQHILQQQNDQLQQLQQAQQQNDQLQQAQLQQAQLQNDQLQQLQQAQQQNDQLQQAQLQQAQLQNDQLQQAQLQQAQLQNDQLQQAQLQQAQQQNDQLQQAQLQQAQQAQLQQAQQWQQQQTQNQMKREQTASSFEAKRRQHEVLSAHLEQEAKKLNPDFKLEPNQMFLILGNQLTIADRSLVDDAFARATVQQSPEQILQTQSLANQAQNVASTSFQTAGVASQQIGGLGQAVQVQPPPLVQQQSYSHLQNNSPLIAGAGSHLQSPPTLSFQQYSGSSQPLQRGTSIGMQPNYSMGQGGRSVQSEHSIFPRNNLPFTPANLDDDDVEIDSEGPKRKKPIQLYGKSSKKANNGSDRNVINLTIENNETVNSKSNLNDDDLEIDYSGPDSTNKYDCKVVLKRIDVSHKIHKLSGVYMNDTVRKESGCDIEMDSVAEDSGVFSMEDKT